MKKPLFQKWRWSCDFPEPHAISRQEKMAFSTLRRVALRLPSPFPTVCTGGRVSSRWRQNQNFRLGSIGYQICLPLVLRELRYEILQFATLMSTRPFQTSWTYLPSVKILNKNASTKITERAPLVYCPKTIWTFTLPSGSCFFRASLNFHFQLKTSYRVQEFGSFPAFGRTTNCRMLNLDCIKDILQHVVSTGILARFRTWVVARLFCAFSSSVRSITVVPPSISLSTSSSAPESNICWTTGSIFPFPRVRSEDSLTSDAKGNNFFKQTSSSSNWSWGGDSVLISAWRVGAELQRFLRCRIVGKL